MKKKTLCILLAALLIAAPLSACGGDRGESPSTSAPDVEKTLIRLSEGDISKLEPYDQLIEILWDDELMDIDTFYTDLNIIVEKELFDPADLPTFRYDSSTTFEGSEELAEQILEAAKNPGLGVRSLHEQGITGAGVNVAIIDQNLLLDHPEYAGRVAAYYDSGCNEPEGTGSMHAPAVFSLLAGETVGVAPGVKVWFAAAPAWEMDAAYFADCLYWILEQNEALPEGEKIRIVSVSSAPEEGWYVNSDQWTEAVAAAEAEGIMVLDCRSNDETGFVYSCYGDPDHPEDVTRCRPGFPNEHDDYSHEDWRAKLFVPSSFRTTAQEYAAGVYIYTYRGNGGRSWAVPYAAGVLALGWQVNPDLDGQTMKELLLQSAWVDENGFHMIDPVAFIELVRETVG